MKPSDLARRRASHTIIFGDPKTGKSTLVAELLMKGYNLTWISMDNGHEIIFKLPLSAEQLDKQLNIIVIPDTKEFPVAIGTCLKIVTGKETKICDAHGQAGCSTCARDTKATWSVVHGNAMGPMDIMVFDHIGQLANSAMNHINKKENDEYKPEWEDYRVQGTLMDKFLTNIQQAPYNVICITHTCETVMEDGTKKLVPLVGTTPFSRNVGKYFDHIIYCQVMNKDHKFGSDTRYAIKVHTGSRSDIRIEDEKAPTLEKFFNGTELAPPQAGAKAVATILARQPEKVTEVIEYQAPEEQKSAPSTLAATAVAEFAAQVYAEAAAVAEPVQAPTPVQAPATTTTTTAKDKLAMLAAMKKGRG